MALPGVEANNLLVLAGFLLGFWHVFAQDWTHGTDQQSLWIVLWQIYSSHNFHTQRLHLPTCLVRTVLWLIRRCSQSCSKPDVRLHAGSNTHKHLRALPTTHCHQKPIPAPCPPHNGQPNTKENDESHSTWKANVLQPVKAISSVQARCIRWKTSQTSLEHATNDIAMSPQCDTECRM